MSRSDPARYEVRMQAAARRALTDRLPEAVAAAVLEELGGSASRCPGPLAGCHGARRGTYRIVYRVDSERHVVQVPDIGHRSSMYRRR